MGQGVLFLRLVFLGYGEVKLMGTLARLIQGSRLQKSSCLGTGGVTTVGWA